MGNSPLPPKKTNIRRTMRLSCSGEKVARFRHISKPHRKCSHREQAVEGTSYPVASINPPPWTPLGDFAIDHYPPYIMCFSVSPGRIHNYCLATFVGFWYDFRISRCWIPPCLGYQAPTPTKSTNSKPMAHLGEACPCQGRPWIPTLGDLGSRSKARRTNTQTRERSLKNCCNYLLNL